MLIPFRKKDKWGFSNPEKEIIIDCDFDDAKPFNEKIKNHAQILIKNEAYWIDINGNLKPFTYFSNSDYIKFSKQNNEFKTSLIKFTENLSSGFKNLKGEIIIPANLFWAAEFINGAYCIGNLGEFWHIDGNGNALYSKRYYFADDFYNDIALVVSDKINSNPLMYPRWVDYYVPIDAKRGYINRQGIEYWND